MTDLIHVDPRPQSIKGVSNDEEASPQRPPAGIPSNEVYARVGDAVLPAAQDGVRRGLPPQDILREIVAAQGIHMTWASSACCSPPTVFSQNAFHLLTPSTRGDQGRRGG